jgi:hypothetical protein
MMVLSDTCEYCNCACSAIRFQQNFKNWTSGNNDIDKIIQSSQQSVHEHGSKGMNAIKVLEWVPYNRLYKIKEDRFGKMYKANWIDGCAGYLYGNIQRYNRNIAVNLNNLDDSKNITFDFLSEV